MKTSNRLFPLLILPTLLLSGCTSIPVTQDYASKTKFVDYQTYQWAPATLDSKPQKLKAKQPFIAERIEKAILNHLKNKDAKLVRYPPQAYISYDYEVERTEVMEPSTTIGVGIGSGNVGFGGVFPVSYEKRTYEDAKWTIDIYDINRTLIWRGSAKQSLQEFSSPKEAEKHTEKVVDQILKQFPPIQPK